MVPGHALRTGYKVMTDCICQCAFGLASGSNSSNQTRAQRAVRHEIATGSKADLPNVMFNPAQPACCMDTSAAQTHPTPRRRPPSAPGARAPRRDKQGFRGIGKSTAMIGDSAATRYATTGRRAKTRRPDTHRGEFPAGYPSAGCSPAEPASVSPAKNVNTAFQVPRKSSQTTKRGHLYLARMGDISIWR